MGGGVIFHQLVHMTFGTLPRVLFILNVTTEITQKNFHAKSTKITQRNIYTSTNYLYANHYTLDNAKKRRGSALLRAIKITQKNIARIEPIKPKSNNTL